MNTDLSQLTLDELTQLAEKAQRALEEKRKESRKAVIAEMKALAAAADLSITIHEGEAPSNTRKGSKVAPKYRHPHDSAITWTGRGMKPRWLADLLEQGHDISAFAI